MNERISWGEWLSYKRTFTRKELMIFGFWCSLIWFVYLLVVIPLTYFIRSHDHSGRWKK